MTTLSLQPSVLKWAAESIGSSVEQIAPHVAALSKLEQIIEGKLTAKQAEKFASLTRVPFGFLFLSEPPEVEQIEIPDLRQTPGAKPLSASFFDTVKDIQQKQEWFIDYLEEVDAVRPDFIGKYRDGGTSVDAIAKDIASRLGCNAELRARCRNKEEYYSALVARVEDSGVLVFKSGVVQNNNHRQLDVAEFRGFALINERAPVVFINGKDAVAAWIFTLIHEVAHIWIGVEGVSDFSASVDRSPQGLEQRCNSIAAEVLTPKDEFIFEWNRTDSPFDTLPRLFKVSSLVIARRALDLNFITSGKYGEILARTRSAESTASAGGDYYKSVVVRNSKKLTRAVVGEALSGRIMLRDAGSLLNISPQAVMEIYNRRGA